MANIYALLIGINNYPVKPLSGCINDVAAMKACLEKLYGNLPESRLHIKQLTDEEEEQPTRVNIIKAFDFFQAAKPGDECLFYFSGHGSSTEAPLIFQSSSNELQSLVCIDSRSPGGLDLMDKELGFLIWKTTQTNKDIFFTAITDCCHSGTITKSLQDIGGVTERLLGGSQAHIPANIEDYLGYGTEIDGIQAYHKTERGGQPYIKTATGKHYHLSASRDYQTAKELPMNEGAVHGAFTYCLLQRLYGNGGLVSYRKLIDDTTVFVKNRVSEQFPSLNTYGGEGLSEQRTFMGQSTAAPATAFELSYSTKNGEGWNINGGALHGIHPGDEILTLKGIRSTVVSAIGPERSAVRPDLGFGATDQMYPVSIQRKADERYTVSIRSGMGLPRVQEFQQALSPGSRLNFIQDGAGNFVVEKNQQDQAIFCQLGNSEALFIPFPSLSAQDIRLFVNYAEKVAAAFHLRALEGNTQDPRPYTVKLFRAIVPFTQTDQDFEEIDPKLPLNDLYYKKSGQEYKNPTIKLSVTNTSSNRFWMSTAYIAFDHAISDVFFLNEEVAPGKTAWLTLRNNGEPPHYIGMEIDKQFRDLGYFQVQEYLKLFITPEKLDTHLLKQDGVELGRFQTKGDEEIPRGPTTVASQKNSLQLYAQTIGFNIVLPQSEINIGAGHAEIGRIQIAAHPSFRAQAAINSSALTQRNADGVAGPNRQHLGQDSAPLDLSGTQRGGGEMDVLEFFAPHGSQDINRENPLLITVAGERGLNEDYNVVPLGYDSENQCYYPLGYSGSGGQVLIETLPEPTSTEHIISLRSFTGSIKIYFQKIIGRTFGLEYAYPRLAVASLDQEGVPQYQSEVAFVREKVKQASKIIMFIHGIIGDTTGMVQCSETPVGTDHITLKDQSELILTFDYENLNTPIEETAVNLKDKLEAVGLGEGHGKSLAIIAHSMGGLVSRSMIERFPSRATALVMLGTPNNGTPWADVRDLAAALITYAVNGTAILKPWLFLLSGIGKLLGGVQHTLKQMDSETGIYPRLNLGQDPKIPYTIIAGNTQMIVSEPEKISRTIAKRLQNALQKGAYAGLDHFLFKLPNDIAVSEDSIKTLKGSASWAKQPTVHIVGENHLSYFTNAEVLALLSAIV